MDRSLDDVWKEVGAFKNLKSAEQKKELENLVQRTKGIKDEISANSTAIKKAERDLESAEAKSEAIRKEYIEARERRQNAVALGEDDEKFKISISNLMVEQDLIEDRCIGLKRRVENLRAEGDLLESERTETERTILRFRLVPLVAQWNEVGGQLGGVLKQIIVLADQLGEPFHETRSGAKTIFYSQWEGIDAIAKLYLAGEVEDPKNRWPNGKLRDIFNFRFFMEDLRQEREKVAEALQRETEKVVVV
jgi:chromosome segregation ATPase